MKMYEVVFIFNGIQWIIAQFCSTPADGNYCHSTTTQLFQITTVNKKRDGFVKQRSRACRACLVLYGTIKGIICAAVNRKRCRQTTANWKFSKPTSQFGSRFIMSKEISIHPNHSKIQLKSIIDSWRACWQESALL